ncbi:hypothetical protein UCDDS831_g07740 [Diplodia seriata]|uniref:Uncharacterized protein n=1 Tax=Diplodia seriata TaxID=420778 RepID=A0A0G2GE00_9PEZI|nr:hypothetical protein UCDDS831_g07740 [Diplodia seriata]
MTSPIDFLVPSGDLALFFALFVSVCMGSWAGFAAVALLGIAANAITTSALAPDATTISALSLARPPAPA